MYKLGNLRYSDRIIILFMIMISSFAFDQMLSRFSMFTKPSGYNIALTVLPKLSEWTTKQNPKNESNVTYEL